MCFKYFPRLRLRSSIFFFFFKCKWYHRISRLESYLEKVNQEYEENMRTKKEKYAELDELNEKRQVFPFCHLCFFSWGGG